MWCAKKWQKYKRAKTSSYALLTLLRIRTYFTTHTYNFYTTTHYYIYIIESIIILSQLFKTLGSQDFKRKMIALSLKFNTFHEVFIWNSGVHFIRKRINMRNHLQHTSGWNRLMQDTVIQKVSLIVKDETKFINCHFEITDITKTELQIYISPERAFRKLQSLDSEITNQILNKKLTSGRVLDLRTIANLFFSLLHFRSSSGSRYSVYWISDYFLTVSPNSFSFIDRVQNLYFTQELYR